MPRIPPVEVVFFDVGGPLYSDEPYYRAVLEAIRERAPQANADRYWEVFEDCRRKQQGSFTRRLIRSFLAEDQLEDVRRRATARWSYPPESVQADAHPALERLSGRYRLGVLANQEAWIRETLERDGLARFFELWAISAEVGIEKPDQRLFEHALREAEVPAERCVMIGDRLDNDIIPARRLGIRTIWLLRGEAPQDPSPEQRHVPDGCVKDLIEVPGRLELLGD